MSDTPIAAFDFDGTLTRRDTLFGFLRFCLGSPAVATGLLRTAPTALRARTGRLPGDVEPRDAGKERLLGDLLGGRAERWYRARGAAYAATLPGRLRPDVLARLAWHRARGHHLVIVSASLHTYLDHFGAEEGFDEIIAVAMEVNDGRLTGSLDGPNVRGPEKEIRLRRLLAQNGWSGPIWAYGNSSGDRELLAMADHPLMVTSAPIAAEPKDA